MLYKTKNLRGRGVEYSQIFALSSLHWLYFLVLPIITTNGGWREVGNCYFK